MGRCESQVRVFSLGRGRHDPHNIHPRSPLLSHNLRSTMARESVFFNALCELVCTSVPGQWSAEELIILMIHICTMTVR